TATVTAHNAVGTAPASEAAAFTTAPTPATVPGAPGNVSIEATHESAKVIWTAPDDGGEPVSGYTVRVFQENAEVRSVSASGTEALLGGLNAETEYSVTVTAHNAVGESAPSEAAAFTTAAEPATAPAAVSEITVEATHESATVKWKAPHDGGSAITGYT
ncbi:fibronectin type III domain-containing protein, partial [Paeniglutamicibacter sp. ORCA_105]|uniref:fibronectin type III domain-containing protein n=1 Tax=Paeniglutamicibacter sp. ORCA_105 TaxID=3377336 RepID=UPI003893618B